MRRACPARAKASVIARILCGAGYAVVFPALAGTSFSPGPNAEGVERRAALPSFVLPRPLLENAGASRRSTAAISVPRGRSFRTRTGPSWVPDPGSFRRPSSAPRPAHRRAVPRNGDGRRPRASRVRGYEPRPRAPHQPASGLSRRRSFAARRRISGACRIVAPSSRRLATTPSAEPGGKEDAEGNMAEAWNLFLYTQKAVIAGLDPAIHDARRQRQSYVKLCRAAARHGCAGQARA